MRRLRVVPWAIVIALGLIDLHHPSHGVSRVAAGPHKAGVVRCVKYKQTLEKDQTSVDLQLTSKCDYEVACSLSWEIRCDSDKDGDATQQATSFTLASGKSQSVNASADRCGDDGWEIAKVRWSCDHAE